MALRKRFSSSSHWLGMESGRKRIPRWAKALIIALGVFVALRAASYWHFPSFLCTQIDRPFSHLYATNLFVWVREFTGTWGELMTFFLAYLIAYLFPGRTVEQTETILSIVRGNLRGINSVYREVCLLLDGIANDPDSYFIMVTQSPLLGADLYPSAKPFGFASKLHGRKDVGRNRIVCLSPYETMPERRTPSRSYLRAFYDDLAAYSPPYSQDREAATPTSRTPEEMFDESRKVIGEMIADRNTDMIFAESIPYQVFLARHSDGSKKCVFLLNGWDAIKHNLPAGGFVSEDLTFIRLIEDAIAVQLGTHASIYSLRFEHTKKILALCHEFAEACGSPIHAETFTFPENLTKPKTFTLMGLEFIRFPWVFDPEISESGNVMAETVLQEIKPAKRRVKKQKRQSPLKLWDVGCGTGSLSVLAAKTRGVQVKAADVNDFALACTSANVRKHGVDDCVQVIPMNQEVFTPFGSEKADIIVADLPFLDCFLPDPASNADQVRLLRAAYFDKKQSLNLQVLRTAAACLETGGRLIISFSDLDSIAVFRQEIDRNGWIVDPISSKSVSLDNHEWFAFVLSRREE